MTYRVADYIEMELRREKRPLSISSIAGLMRLHKVPFGASSPKAMRQAVLMSLKRNPHRFLKLEGGSYTLMEWVAQAEQVAQEAKNGRRKKH